MFFEFTELITALTKRALVNCRVYKIIDKHSIHKFRES